MQVREILPEIAVFIAGVIIAIFALFMAYVNGVHTTQGIVYMKDVFIGFVSMLLALDSVKLKVLSEAINRSVTTHDVDLTW